MLLLSVRKRAAQLTANLPPLSATRCKVRLLQLPTESKLVRTQGAEAAGWWGWMASALADRRSSCRTGGRAAFFVLKKGKMKQTELEQGSLATALSEVQSGGLSLSFD